VANLLIIEDNPDLARLLASIGEMRGHLTRVASTGAEAMVALGEQRFEAAIVDLFLPDIEPSELFARLKTAQVPAFAMSGVYKGDAVATEATQRHGAIAFFQKPFRVLEMLKQVEHLTGVAERQPPPPPPDAFDVPLEVTVTEPEPEPQPDLPPIDAWERSWKTAPPPKPAPKAQLARTGSLKTTNVPLLLNACYQAHLNGDLLLKHGGSAAVKSVSLDAGQPVYAVSNLAHERFARFCARKGVLRADDLDAVAQLAKEAGLKTGEAMLKLNVIDDAQRRALLQEQMKEIIWSTFLWAEGEYVIAPERPLREGAIKLPLFPADLIVEGCLKTPLLPLRERLPATLKLSPTAAPPYPLEGLKFTGEQARLIAYADGTKTVADLLALTDLAERDVLALLYALLQTGFVEARASRPHRVSFGL
jgi:CheY-like chemotaxis protein